MSSKSGHSRNWHHTVTVLSHGTAYVSEPDVPMRVVPATLVRNLYGQEVVWGDFGYERKKNQARSFKGWTGEATNANTENVVYEATSCK